APRELGLEFGDLFGELLGTGEGGLGLGAGGLGALALGLGAALRRLGLGGAGLEDDLLTLVAELLDLFPGGVLARGLLRDADALARDIGVVLDEVGALLVLPGGDGAAERFGRLLERHGRVLDDHRVVDGDGVGLAGLGEHCVGTRRTTAADDEEENDEEE